MAKAKNKVEPELAPFTYCMVCRGEPVGEPITFKVGTAEDGGNWIARVCSEGCKAEMDRRGECNRRGVSWATGTIPPGPLRKKSAKGQR